MQIVFELFVPTEPLAVRTGRVTTERKIKLRNAIMAQVSQKELTTVKGNLQSRTVSLEVVFQLWKGPPTVSDTIWIKDVDNLLNVLFDVLGDAAPGLGLVSDDSYICEVHATKVLVDSKKQEGYQIKIQDYKDDRMLSSLNESFLKRKKRLLKKDTTKDLTQTNSLPMKLPD